MKVLKATEEQYQELNGFQSGVAKLEFVKDADNNWIVSKAVKHYYFFDEIVSKLDELEEIDYNPVIVEVSEESSEIEVEV